MNLEDVFSLDASAKQTLIVSEADTAAAVGSGLANVLATPRLIELLEAAALVVTDRKLTHPFQSLGIHLDFQHIAATPIGMQVTVVATLASIEKNRLMFDIEARDEVEIIGHGVHTRVVVDAVKFQGRVDSKVSSMQG